MPGLHDTNGLRRGPRGETDHGLAVLSSATPARARVAFAGELDLAGVATADQALRDAEQDGGELVLDLCELTFIDVAGLAVVISANRRARTAGRRFVVRVRSTCVRRLFELTRAERSLDIVIDGEATAPSPNGRPRATLS